jgi:hypothetical protein
MRTGGYRQQAAGVCPTAAGTRCHRHAIYGQARFLVCQSGARHHKQKNQEEAKEYRTSASSEYSRFSAERCTIHRAHALSYLFHKL